MAQPAAGLASWAEGPNDSASLGRAGGRNRLAYIRDHGTARVVMGGVLVWLLPAAIAGTQHSEAISWSALGVAVAGGIVLSWQGLRCWRVWAAIVALSVLGAMLALLLMETAGVLAAASRPALSGTTYREVRGAGACTTSSCGGHEAGWRWAERRDIQDPDKCGGRSQSFEDGCRAYAEEASGSS